MDSQPVEATIVKDVKPSEEVVTVEILAGHPEGFVDKNGETIVADLDDSGNVIGWHKEPAGGDK